MSSHYNRVMRKRKYQLDEKLFNYIDSEAKAYWLGFLAADGSISKYSLSLELNNKDIKQIENFRYFIKSNYQIKPTRKNCSRLRVNSVILNQSLIALGIHPNKTSDVQTPPLQSKLLQHFYRGVFDGDGWITSRIRKPAKTNRKRKNKFGQYYSENARYCEIGFSSGSKQFINEIHKWIQTKLKINCGFLIKRQKKNQSVYQLTFGGNQLFEKVLNLLYQEATIYLDRKKEIAINLLTSIH